jgi:threonine dehydrogenase-like Zn-dependent dehydrogenase
VGAPDGGPELPIRQLFVRNVNVAGGVAPVRTYLPELLGEVLDGTIDPGRVFDLAVPLDEVAQAYTAMDSRRAIKSLVRP